MNLFFFIPVLGLPKFVRLFSLDRVHMTRYWTGCFMWRNRINVFLLVMLKGFRGFAATISSIRRCHHFVRHPVGQFALVLFHLTQPILIRYSSLFRVCMVMNLGFYLMRNERIYEIMLVLGPTIYALLVCEKGRFWTVG